MKFGILKIILILVLALNFSNSFSKGRVFEEGYIRLGSNVNAEDIIEQLKKNEGISVKWKMLKIEMDKQFPELNINKFLSNSSSKNDKLLALYSTAEILERTYRVEFDGEGMSIKDINLIGKKYEEIEIIEPRYKSQFLGSVNDEFVSNQEYLNIIKAFAGWDIETGDEDIVIGLSDSGMFQNHEDLKDGISVNEEEIPFNNIDDDGNGYIDDYKGVNLAHGEDEMGWGNTINANSHGQNVVGFFGARTNNEIGIAGVSYNCKLFPIKIASNNSTETTYDYESIVYAADNGFDVLNCSWGSESPFSPIQYSIIQYAQARDVLIVAAAGNTGLQLGVGKIIPWYPAAYDGVLGVSSCNVSDRMAQASSYGVHSRIVAPGEGGFTTTNSTQAPYSSNSITGSSFAAPIISGAAGLLMSKYPNLSNNQILELLRQGTDDISGENEGFWGSIIPGRLNLEKALSIDPMSIPGLRIKEVIYKNENGFITDNFQVGETITVSFKLFNYLGGRDLLSFEIKEGVSLVGGGFEIVKNRIEVSDVMANSMVEVGPFEIKITDLNTTPHILKLEIKGDNDYSDFLKFKFLQTSEDYVFSNEMMEYSVYPSGKFGYAVDKDNSYLGGKGFSRLDMGNEIYDGALIATINDDIALSAQSSPSDFSLVFFDQDLDNLIVKDNTDNNSGLEISQFFKFHKANSAYTKIKIVAKNNGDGELNNLAVGYVMDWDIGYRAGYFERNYIELLPEAIPNELVGVGTAAEIAYNDEDEHYVGVAITSGEGSAIAQSAGVDSYYVTLMYEDDQIDALRSGTSIQHTDRTDIGHVIGMRYEESLQVNEERECELCLAIGKSREEIKSLINKCLSSNIVEEQEEVKNYLLTSDYNGISIVNLGDNEFSFKVYNYLGQEILLQESALQSNHRISIDLTNGFYLVKLRENNKTYIEKALVK